MGDFLKWKKIRFNFDKNALGYILGDFFTYSSGHPAVDVASN
jgi:hypothetical protein